MTLLWNNFARFGSRFGREYRRSSTVLSFNHDGLELARVKSDRRWLPVWHIAVFLYLAMLIRLIVMADIGPAAYGSRLDKLNDGNVIERFAATVMQMDPVSQAIANNVRSSLRGIGFN